MGYCFNKEKKRKKGSWRDLHTYQLQIFLFLMWSDLALFSIFENLHVSADQGIFFEFNSKKSAILAARPRIARAAKFSFLKNHAEASKIIIFFENLLKPF